MKLDRGNASSLLFGNVGLAVITLLFVAKATPEFGSPKIVASQHTVAPAPDMTPRPALAAQPQSALVDQAKSRRQRV